MLDSTATSTSTSTTWPWLKDCDTGLTTTDPPIPPIDQYDDRPSVVSLLVEHQSYIDQVRDELCLDPLYNCHKHDDLWILRFVLSHKKNVSSAVRAAKYTLAFRKEHQLDDHDVRYHNQLQQPTPSANTNTNNTNDSESSLSSSVQRYMKYVRKDAIRFVIPDHQRSVILFIDISGVNQHELVANVKESDWLPSYLYYNEMAYQWIDYITRRTGRLTKLVRIIDGQNIMPWKTINYECCRRDCVVMKMTEDCLLSTIIRRDVYL